ncbi:MAG: hypothetical protein K2W94_08915 [Alphaproteobacteria bacterium]|nr:hypothetical protein [Alphaproteobacteria bacterium]
MVSLFIFPFSLLRLSFSIFIVLGVSLATTGDVRAAVSSDQVSPFALQMMEKVKKVQEGKDDSHEVIKWLKGEGKSFPFDNENAQVLVTQLFMSPHFDSEMIEIPYLRKMYKNIYNIKNIAQK